MRSWIRILPCLFLLFAFPARAQDSNSGSDSQAGVLCVWSIYVELKTFGTVCGFDPNSNVAKLIDESITRIDKFITDNSDITQAQLDEKKNAILAHEKEESEDTNKAALRNSCSGNAMNAVSVAYHKLAATNPEAVRQRISTLLAVPRKPVMGPCM